MVITMKKRFRPKEIRDWQRARTKDWRERYYALGLTYKKVDGHWGWAPRKGRTPARIHLSNSGEIEEIRKKIQMAMRKEADKQ